ncbi:MAG: autoinducer binding domain-containing protein [Pseudomonadota bacterium]
MTQTVVKPQLSELAPAGYYVAIRIGFAFPVHEENGLPPEWVELYTTDGLMLRDPIVNWMYGNVGTIRWSDIDAPDPNAVLQMARQHGLVYGAVACCMDETTGERSYGSFARSDREFMDHELTCLHGVVSAQHTAMRRPAKLTQAESEALRHIRDGLRFKEIAHLLGISESAVKARLTNAKRKLNAKTSVQAVSIASSFGMI